MILFKSFHNIHCFRVPSHLQGNLAWQEKMLKNEECNILNESHAQKCSATAMKNFASLQITAPYHFCCNFLEHLCLEDFSELKKGKVKVKSNLLTSLLSSCTYLHKLKFIYLEAEAKRDALFFVEAEDPLYLLCSKCSCFSDVPRTHWWDKETLCKSCLL